MKKIIASILILCFTLTGGFGKDAHAAAAELFSMSLYTDANLTAYYRLENATDSEDSGTDYDLTNTNSVTFSAAVFNKGGNFNGTNQTLSNNNVVGVTGYPRTITGWFVPDSVTVSDRAIYCLGDGAIHYYCLKIRSSDSHLVFRSNNNTQAADIDTLTTSVVGATTSFAIIQNSATNLDIYLNGSANVTGTTTYSATVSRFNLGYLGRSNVWYYDGRIDDVALFNRALTAQEISDIYNGVAVAGASPVAGPILLE